MIEDKVFLTEKEISKTIDALSNQLKEYLQSQKLQNPVFLCVLKGSFMFFSDLMKAIGNDVDVDFIRCKSYEDNKRKGNPIVQYNGIDLEGRDIVIVEDIVDSGETVRSLFYFLKQFSKVKTVTVASLLIRKEFLIGAIHDELYQMGVRFFTEEVIKDDSYVYGYGLDDNNKKRTLKNIFIK